jgi:hypothetical protein
LVLAVLVFGDEARHEFVVLVVGDEARHELLMNALDQRRAREGLLGGPCLLEGRAAQTFAWPFHMIFDVAGLGDKYLATVLALR